MLLTAQLIDHDVRKSRFPPLLAPATIASRRQRGIGVPTREPTGRFVRALLNIHRSPFGSYGQAPVNTYFEALLETGVDEMAWDDLGDDSVSPVAPPGCHTGCLLFQRVFWRARAFAPFSSLTGLGPGFHRCSNRSSLCCVHTSDRAFFLPPCDDTNRSSPCS